MASPITNSFATSALRPAGSLPADAKKAEEPGQKPFTRSAPQELRSPVKHDALRTSMESPHVPSAGGKLGNERVGVDVRGLPTHLLFRNSNGEVGVAHKVKHDEAASKADQGSKSRASASSPHVVGARGDIGNPKVGVDPRGVPDHLLAVQNGEPVLAQKVKPKAE